MNPLSFRVSIVLLLSGVLYSACTHQPDHDALIKSITASEQIMQQAERDGLPETLSLSAQTLDSLYQVYIRQWPDSSRSATFLYNRATLLADYLDSADSSIIVLDALISSYPSSEWIEKARFLKGYTLNNRLQDTTRAGAAYREFLREHPTSELTPSVQFELNTMGKSIDDIERLLQDKIKP
jgi:TolA-binding protein